MSDGLGNEAAMTSRLDLGWQWNSWKGILTPCEGERQASSDDDPGTPHTLNSHKTRRRRSLHTTPGKAREPRPRWRGGRTEGYPRSTPCFTASSRHTLDASAS
uniref:Uncharacterized protein n=1 Tax=Rhipicephalus zambeziensis TaxID=60191 RepID=A0A224YFA8_9ACAR